MKPLTALILMVLLALSTSGRADEWPQAVTRDQSSANGQFTVRVIPGDSWGDVEGFAGREKGRYASAEWYRSTNGTPELVRTITLLNPIAPVDFVVTDDGALVTLDNWHNQGKGDMLAIYSPAGEVLKKYSLDDLYVYRDVMDFGRSTSSTLWRCHTESSLALKSPTELWVDDTIGGRLVINPGTGNFEYRRGAGSCDMRPPAEPPVIPESVLALPWGDETDGLRVNVSANVAQPLPDERLLLNLHVWIRNVSDAPIPANLFYWPTYDFEYEIDGTWYAFEDHPIPHPRGAAVRARLAAQGRHESEMWLTIAPGDAGSSYLNVPLVAPSPVFQLLAITEDGLGRRFEPTPGTHTLRVRPRGVLEPSRRAPVSNTVSFTLRALPEVETRNQEVSFVRSQGTPWESLRFVDGPAGDQALIRQVLARPPQPTSVPLVVHSAVLQVYEPLPFYIWRLPRTPGAPDPALPTTSSWLSYLVRGGTQLAAFINLKPSEGRNESADAPTFVTIDSAAPAESLFNALQDLAGIEAVRNGSYEPRRLQVSDAEGKTSVMVIWLHSSSGQPDLFYRPRDSAFRDVTSMESGTLHTVEELLAATVARE